jgi:hypothetical protein
MFPADGGTRFALQIFEKIPEKKLRGWGRFFNDYFKKKIQKNFDIQNRSSIFAKNKY